MMMFTIVNSAVVLIATSVTAAPSSLIQRGALATKCDDVKFDVRFDPTAALQDACPIANNYESTAAAEALSHLHDRIKATGVGGSCCYGDQISDIYKLKECIVTTYGVDTFFKLLADDITAANTFWHNIVDNSTPSKNMMNWVPARAWVRAYYQDLNATQFAGWTLSPAADSANVDANPEHYIKNTTIDATAGTVSAIILEGWGGVRALKMGTIRTNFTIPSYTLPKFDDVMYPSSWSVPGFALPWQRIGPKQLTDGKRNTTFGVLHIAVRDGRPEELVDGKKFIEVYSAVWYPPYDKVTGGDVDHDYFVKNYLRDESEHMVNEVLKLTIRARRDISGQ